jgi:ATP-dependent DNA helicase PIF1
MVLSEEQADVLEKVKSGDNVFFTGSAGSYSYMNHLIVMRHVSSTRISGTGKTVLLREILRVLRSPSCRVAVTASTGIASINIGGTTLHSWAGIGLGEGTAKRLSGKILGTERLKERWRDVDSLIIDESKIFSLRVDLILNTVLVSMISGGLFDKLVSLQAIFVWC